MAASCPTLDARAGVGTLTQAGSLWLPLAKLVNGRKQQQGGPGARDLGRSLQDLQFYTLCKAEAAQE